MPRRAARLASLYNLSLRMKTNETRIRVCYADTDQMGVVYYSNYLIWMEMGRGEFCRALGLRYRDMERNDGIVLAVAEANCRYISPARYDDEVIVKTWIKKANTRLMEFGYEMRNASGDVLLAKGYTKHLICGLDMKPRRLPEAYRELFGI